MDFSRLRTGEIIAGIAGIALLVFMFFDWFEGGGGGFEVETQTQELPGVGEVEVPTGGGTAEPEGVSGWDSLRDWDGFLVLLAGLSGVALAMLTALGRRINLGGAPRGAGTAVLASLATLMILWRWLLGDQADVEFGLFLGLAATIALTVGALMALRDGGFEPLVKVAGGRTRTAASASTTRRAASGSARKSSGSRSGSSRSGSRSSASRSSSSKSRSSSSRGRSGGGRKKS